MQVGETTNRAPPGAYFKETHMLKLKRSTRKSARRALPCSAMVF